MGQSAISAEARNRDGVIPTETLPNLTKGIETGLNEGKLSDFWNSTREQ